MNNMLYIIAGLVIIAIVAVLFLKKNKSQAPARPLDHQPPSRPNAAADTTAPTATKFDDLTVAQRFIDQQRYDRAIETLDRGLNENPNNQQLRLKLLNVYALTKQTEDFYNTYQVLTQQADAATINEAQKLKDLFDAEQGQNTGLSSNRSHTQTIQPTVIKETPVTASSDDLTFDFNLADDETQQPPVSPAKAEQPVAPSTELNIDRKEDHNEFDLTLEDLEASEFDFETPNHQTTQAPVTADLDLHNAEDNAFNFDDFEKTTAETHLEPQAVSESQDEALSFDDIDVLALNESAPVKAEAETKEATLDDTNFDFDLDLDLDEAEDQPIASANKPSIDETTATQDLTTEDSFDDFALDLTEVDDKASSLSPTANTFSDELLLQAEQEDQIEQAKSENITDDDFAMFGLEEAAFDNNETGSESAPVAPKAVPQNDELLFDDNTPIDELDFDFQEQPTIAESLTKAPVDIEATPSQPVSTSDNLTEQFAADFDFVTELDQNQVTLELAEQYLELGEYDSAKRLLNEVIAQGNDSQQNHAQALLAKTA